MTETTSRGRGGAWKGDWGARLTQALHTRGFHTARAFIAAHPTSSFLELSRMLEPDELAPVQLEWAVLDEAEAEGAMESCARDLFVRRMHEAWPGGWSSAPEARRQFVTMIAGWESSIRSHLPGHAKDVQAVADHFTAEVRTPAQIPEGWLPVTPNDPILVEAFRGRWGSGS